MCHNRFKNPYFWFGLVGVVLTAMGIDPHTLTSWDVIFQAVKDLIANPVMLGSVILAITGVFVDPTCKGLKDKEGKD